MNPSERRNENMGMEIPQTGTELPQTTAELWTTANPQTRGIPQGILQMVGIPRVVERLAWFFVVCVVLLSGGCKAFRAKETSTNDLFASLPARLQADPDVGQICSAVNENANRIGTLRSENATLNIAKMGIPPLRTQFVCQRPKRMRITGTALSLTGLAFDLGSNDERFWFWMDGDANVYYCNHVDYPAVARTGALPVDPKLLFVGLGMEQIGDDEQVVAGPVSIHGLLAIRTVRPETSDAFSLWSYIDPRQGVAVYHVMQTPEGRTLATVTARDFLHDPASGALVPRQLDLVMAPSEGTPLELTLNLKDLAVNPAVAGATAWAMPNYSDKTQPIDLGARVKMSPNGSSVMAMAPMSLRHENGAKGENGVGAGLLATNPNASPLTSPVSTTGSVNGYPSLSVAPNSYATAERTAGTNVTTGTTSTTTVGKLPDFDLTASPDYSILPQEIAPQTHSTGDPFHNTEAMETVGIAGNGANTANGGNAATETNTETRNPMALSIPAPPDMSRLGAVTTEETKWIAPETKWENAAGPELPQRRILVPNRPTTNTTEGTVDTTNTEPELVLPAGASRLW